MRGRGILRVDTRRHQLDLSKPVGNEKHARIVRKSSSVLHFTVESHNHLRSPSAFKGGSTQLWHLDNGHGRSLALVAYLADRVFQYAEVGMGAREVQYKKGDCALLTSWVLVSSLARKALGLRCEVVLHLTHHARVSNPH